MDKQKYYGTFNFNGQNITLWTHAVNKNRAKAQFIIQLAEKLNRSKGSIRRYYAGVKANYEIKEIKT